MATDNSAIFCVCFRLHVLTQTWVSARGQTASTVSSMCFNFESVAGESTHVWNVICALIPFHRASCPTQMSALRVSTDNLITQGPLHLLCVRRHAPPHSPLQFIASVRPSPSSSSPPPLTVSSVSNFHPFVSICTFIGHTFPFFSSSLPPLFPLHPSPTHCYTSIFLLRFLLFHPSLHSLRLLSLSICHPPLSPV